jgi:pimeloyl-ACP methyl ester carboxylesterase
MEWLFLLGLWLVCEGTRYYQHCRKLRRWRLGRKACHPLRDSWIQEQQQAILQPDLHFELNRDVVHYESGARSVLHPQYKPLLYYSCLRWIHGTAYTVARCCGWTCSQHQGVWFWERGTGPVVLFLHGFGFGPYAYGMPLQQLSTQYRIIAPQYPGLSYDGHTELPEIQDYARTIVSFLSPRCYHIVSNSFGTVVHNALLRELGPRATSTVRSQTYVEPVCFYPYAGQLFSFLKLSWRNCLQAPTLRAQLTNIVSYLLVTKDCSTLYMCQQILEDPKWDGEAYLRRIPSTVILSELDALIRVPQLAEHLTHHYPSCNVKILAGIAHGQALFSSGLKIAALLSLTHPNDPLLPPRGSTLQRGLARSESLPTD